MGKISGRLLIILITNSPFIYAGIALGVWVSLGISGGHINPAARHLCPTATSLTETILHVVNSLLRLGEVSHGRRFPVNSQPFMIISMYLSDKNPFTIGYIFGQLMGGIVGAVLVYANYFHAIDIYEGGQGIRTFKTAGLFSTYAVSLFNADNMCP